MKRAFVIRPFGVKEGIDFDRTESDLIDPVLNGLGITGRTTGEILAAGNIRSDVFERLLVADLVIADISIHNANVYYELGVRHALRDRMTVLIRAHAAEVPFDLRTDRYVLYDRDDPARARDALRDAIEQTDAIRRADSPVFTLLPALRPVDPERLKIVPSDFAEEVRQAAREGDLPRLAVLQDETVGFDWAIPGLRLIGTAQFDHRAWPDARASWEAIRRELPRDPEANLKLATIFQRLDEFARSSEAIERVLADPSLDDHDRAEALSLKASNTKTQWCTAWRGGAEPAVTALRSPLLDEARRTYDEGFLADQDHWYAGINALALTRVTRLLADLHHEVWSERFEDDDAADRELRRLAVAEAELAAAVRRSLDAAAARRLRRNDGPDVWLELTRADLLFLTSDRPARIRHAYAEALGRSDATSGGFAAEAAARQIRLYRDLGVFAETAAAALEGLGVPEQPAPQPDVPRPRVLVFAGHRVDAPDRAHPRFPRTQDAEHAAARMIAEAIADERAAAGDGAVEGIAGGASGGDILFHEACHAAGIPTTLMLAIPRDSFAAASVNDAGAQWTERFRRLCNRGAVKVLSDSAELPGWLRVRGDYSIWQRNTRWILHTALSRADTDVTLIVLWDGGGGDGPGGTADMVELARHRGVKVVRLGTARLLGPTPPEDLR
ncbi:tetratricopeptide repeat-containing protein [Geodermatophilus sp. SYSU D00710]